MKNRLAHFAVAVDCFVENCRRIDHCLDQLVRSPVDSVAAAVAADCNRSTETRFFVQNFRSVCFWRTVRYHRNLVPDFDLLPVDCRIRSTVVRSAVGLDSNRSNHPHCPVLE